jgi:hypothetical protein
VGVTTGQFTPAFSQDKQAHNTTTKEQEHCTKGNRVLPQEKRRSKGCTKIETLKQELD